MKHIALFLFAMLSTALYSQEIPVLSELAYKYYMKDHICQSSEYISRYNEAYAIYEKALKTGIGVGQYEKTMNYLNREIDTLEVILLEYKFRIYLSGEEFTKESYFYIYFTGPLGGSFFDLYIY